MVPPPAPPPPSSYRPWEDTSPATPPSFLNGRPSLPLPAPSAMADRRPSIQSPAPSTHTSRKRRRLSNERLDRLYLPGVGSSCSPSGTLSVDVRGGDGSGGSMYRRGPDAVGDMVLSSAYIKPLTHNSNHFIQPPQPPPSTPPSITPTVTLFFTPGDTIAAAASILFSAAQRPYFYSLLPSIEALTTCLETIYGLLVRLKSTSSSQQSQSNSISNEQQAAYTSNLSHLQHSLSTLRLAHSTLNTEHTNLLSAFNRSQTRTAALDRKLLVCTEETESLANERERLMGVVEGLEESLLEVRAERDEMRLEMRRSGAQWGSIVQNAGKLERGSCKAEKVLRKEVEGLKNDIERLRAAVVEGSGGCCAAVGEAGEKERVELKARVRELEGRLEEMRSEGKGIYELAELISKMGKGIAEPR